MSLKELMLEMRGDVKHNSHQLDILVSQNLPPRVEVVEDWQTKADGRLDVVARAFKVFAAITVVVISGIVLGFI